MRNFLKPHVFLSIPDDGNSDIDSGYQVSTRLNNIQLTPDGQVMFQARLQQPNDSWCNYTWWSPKSQPPQVMMYLIIEEGHRTGVTNLYGQLTELDVSSEYWSGHCPHFNQRHFWTKPFSVLTKPGSIVQAQTYNDSRFITFRELESTTNGIGVTIFIQLHGIDRKFNPRDGDCVEGHFLDHYDNNRWRQAYTRAPEKYSVLGYSISTDVHNMPIADQGYFDVDKYLRYETHEVDGITSDARWQKFVWTYSERPGVFGMVNSYVGGDEITVRGFNFTRFGFSVMAQEDKCNKQSLIHIQGEKMTFLVIGQEFRPTSRPTAMPTSIPTIVPTSKPTRRPTWRPTRRPTSCPICATCDPTGQPTGRPTGSPSYEPTVDPTTSPTVDPSALPTVDPTFNPTTIPSSQPSRTPTTKPSVQPTRSPSSMPSEPPTSKPTTEPTYGPTSEPSVPPSSIPSRRPSAKPTVKPTVLPSTVPTKKPTSKPSTKPTKTPTNLPSNLPTVDPTSDPTTEPTLTPSSKPTTEPSTSPSARPSSGPSSRPSKTPTSSPTRKPTGLPTPRPTWNPTGQPTGQPTSSPSSCECLCTAHPTVEPTYVPSVNPTSFPSSLLPTYWPTLQPSAYPTHNTSHPTFAPTYKPSVKPSSRRPSRPSRTPSNRPNLLPISAAPVLKTQPFAASGSLKPGSATTKQPTFKPWTGATHGVNDPFYGQGINDPFYGQGVNEPFYGAAA